LHHVAGVVLIAGEPVGQRVDVPIGNPDQLVERVAVAAAGGFYQRGVLGRQLTRYCGSDGTTLHLTVSGAKGGWAGW